MYDPFAQLPVTHHSKHVGPGSVFVAIKGLQDDGVRYIPEALARGASEIIVDNDVVLSQELLADCKKHTVSVTRVANTRHALAERSAAVHGYPADSLCMIGITGTKGKTTTCFLLRHILAQTGLRTALLTTVKNYILDVCYPTELTTQQPDYLHAFFAQCKKEGVTHVIVEVAAQALSLHRLDGIKFQAAAFLNFSREHGEFYPDQHDYWSAKASIVRYITAGGSIILPHDDTFKVNFMVPDGIKKVFLSQQDVHTIEPNLYMPEVRCMHEGRLYRCPTLMGSHNGANLLVALKLAAAVGIGCDKIPSHFTSFTGVPGRLNWYPLPNGAMGCIDYAHNPASFEATLSMLRACSPHVILVFGAGGERDRARRPQMGAIAARYADYIVLTSDNPRSELPIDICNDILEGIDLSDRHKVMIELDRELAIIAAYAASRSKSLLILLGKGPDEYQIISGVKQPFSEKAILFNL